MDCVWLVNLRFTRERLPLHSSGKIRMYCENLRTGTSPLFQKAGDISRLFASFSSCLDIENGIETPHGQYNLKVSRVFKSEFKLCCWDVEGCGGS